MEHEIIEECIDSGEIPVRYSMQGSIFGTSIVEVDNYGNIIKIIK